jgi:hypothetical protein
MSALLQKANSGPLAAIPVNATEPIVMNGAVAPVSFIVSGISIVSVCGYPTDTTILG